MWELSKIIYPKCLAQSLVHGKQQVLWARELLGPLRMTTRDHHHFCLLSPMVLPALDPVSSWERASELLWSCLSPHGQQAERPQERWCPLWESVSPHLEMDTNSYLAFLSWCEENMKFVMKTEWPALTRIALCMTFLSFPPGDPEQQTQLHLRSPLSKTGISIIPSVSVSFCLYLPSLFFITCLCANGVPTYIFTYVQVCMHMCTEARIVLERLFEHSLHYSLRQAFSWAQSSLIKLASFLQGPHTLASQGHGLEQAIMPTQHLSGS